MQTKWYNRSKWIVVLLHALCWIIIFALPFLIRTSNDADQHRSGPDQKFIYFYAITRLFWIALFYLNALVLFPKLIRFNKYTVFIVLQVVAIGVISGLHSLVFNLVVKSSPYNIVSFLQYNIYTYFFILAASTAYFMVLNKIETDQLIQQRENENLKTELLFLRSQVSPHFMFNVLNNMVALARKQSDQLEPSLIKLSSLMRYMLYETDDNKVMLEKEIEYLESYIDLQQLRFGKNVQVNTFLERRTDGYEIEPMLLIPFVENAFKHGTGLIEHAQIDIELALKAAVLCFTVRNRYNPEDNEVKDKTSGIGLTNVQRRLNLLYGNKHSLNITRNDNWFIVTLQINLHA